MALLSRRAFTVSDAVDGPVVVWPTSGTGVTLPDLLPGKVLSVTFVFVLRNEGPLVLVPGSIVRLEYAIEPALEPEPGTVDDEAWRRWAASNTWEIAGYDSTGAEYWDGGGAYGLDADRGRTLGEWDLAPSLSMDATWLNIVFAGARTDAHSFRQRVLHIDLPLPVLTLEESVARRDIS